MTNFIKKILPNIILVLFSTLFPLILFEYFLYKNDFKKEFRNYKTNINNINYQFNDDIKDYFNNKDNNNLIFFGDSFIVSNKCAGYKKDPINLVKKKLKNYNYNIYNFASIGRGPADYLNKFDYFLNTNLKRIIVVLNYNDIEISIDMCKTMKALYENNLINEIPKECKKILEIKKDRYSGSFLKTIDNLFEKTRTWQFIRDKLYSFKFLRKYYGITEIEQDYKNIDSKKYRVYLNLLKQISNKANNNNILLDFVYYPDTIYLSNKNPKIWENFINYANDNNIFIHNSWKYFLQKKKSITMRASLIDYHPSCDANEIFADYLIDYIL